MVRIETAIGGGLGDPLDRDPMLVASDVLDGYLGDASVAERVYGVVLGADGTVDADATERTRSARRGEQPAVDRCTEGIELREPTFTPQVNR
jgi:N-methylhydantoinase B